MDRQHTTAAMNLEPPLPTKSEDSARTYFGVQALRAVAALMVVEHHAAGSWGERIAATADATPTWMNGEAGVDIFFVISGFVMAVSAPALAGQAHQGRVFLRRRLVRLVPLYWIVTTLRLLRLELGPSVGGQTAGSAWHIIASYLFIPSTNNLRQPFPLLTVGWTLSYEMAFYLLFAAALALDLRPLAFLLPTLTMVAVVGCFDQTSWPTFTTVASPLVLEFLYGIVLAHVTLQRRLPGQAVSVLLFIVGFTAILTIPPANLMRAIYWGLPAAAIVTGTVGLEASYGKRLPKWLLEAGNASYAIYLIHLFVVGAVWVVLLRLGQKGYPALAEMIVISCALSLLAGEVIHRLVELPLMKFFRGRRVPGVSVLPTTESKWAR